MLSNELTSYDYEEFLDESEKAWKLKIETENGIEDLWLPKSTCNIYPGALQVEVPEWLAEKKNLC